MDLARATGVLIGVAESEVPSLSFCGMDKYHDMSQGQSVRAAEQPSAEGLRTAALAQAAAGKQLLSSPAILLYNTRSPPSSVFEI
jgi:hypothetical protein